MMGFGTDTTDSLGDLGHVFSQSSLTEFLKSPEFGDLEIAILNLASIVKKDIYLAMAFQPGNRVNGYLLHDILALLNRESGRL
jgi:hypothetical protein